MNCVSFKHCLCHSFDNIGWLLCASLKFEWHFADGRTAERSMVSSSSSSSSHPPSFICLTLFLLSTFFGLNMGQRLWEREKKRVREKKVPCILFFPSWGGWGAGLLETSTLRSQVGRSDRKWKQAGPAGCTGEELAHGLRHRHRQTVFIYLFGRCFIAK
jgi:hypothetical protein